MTRPAHSAAPASARGARTASGLPSITPTGPVAVAATAVTLTVLIVLAGADTWIATPDSGAGVRALDVACALLGGGIMLFARRAPVAVATMLCALAALSPTVTPLAGTTLLWMAARSRLPVAVSVALVGVVAQVARGLWRPISLPLGWAAAFHLAIFGGVVAWGAMVRARRALIASLEERAWRAESDRARHADDARRAERARIAREMHDVLAHRLSLLATFAGALEYRPDAPPEQLARAAGEVRASAHQALDELREVIGVLRDDDAHDPEHDGHGREHGGRDHVPPPQPTIADLPRLVAESRTAGMDVEVEATALEGVPAGIGRTAYRVVQEALTNARRHAPDRPVRIALHGSSGDGLTIEVRNPLPAATPAPPRDAGGSGLIGLAERATLAGGCLDHEATADGQFVLRAWLPWRA